MGTFRTLFSYVMRHKTEFVISLVAMLFTVFLSLIPPQLFRLVVDDAILIGDSRKLIIYSSAIIILFLFMGIFGYIRRYYAQKLSQKVLYDLRNDLYSHLMNMSFSFFDRRRTGQLLSRVTSDVENIRFMLSMGFIMMIYSVLSISLTFTILCSMNLFLAVIVSIPFPFLLYGAYRYNKIVRPKFYEIRTQFGKLTSIIQQNITGSAVVKAFNAEELEIKRFAEKNEEYLRMNINVAKVRAKYMSALIFIVGVSALLVFWAGGILTIQGVITLGTLIAFYGYVIQLVMPARFLGFLVSFYSQAMAAGERILEILNEKPAVVEKPDAIELPPIKGNIKFENVSFKYGDKWILKNVSFEIPAGKTVVILGTTGAGKSTILKLIPRFYDVTEGRILIDGYDIRDVKLESLRKQIGIVPQDIFLFSGTIRENIAYGKPDATEEEIIRAAKLANIHDFIVSLPDKYDTIIGERGVTLSGGQRQRVAIARAILTDPRILILDDATSSVDVKTEYEIQKALEQVLKGRTSIIVTQRMSVVKKADMIIVLDKGRVVGIGTHDELYQKNPVYTKIFDAQLIGAITPKQVIAKDRFGRVLRESHGE
ncbi:MAG: ABC transporter ATP-binding protein [Candidatus Odinarchaeota archaeon]|nr:ABC transporter ATP-binding protein [Candidatus Odinarchaeota archaeon]